MRLGRGQAGCSWPVVGPDWLRSAGLCASAVDFMGELNLRSQILGDSMDEDPGSFDEEGSRL